MGNIDINAGVLAKEVFNPKLSNEYNRIYHQLLEKLGKAYFEHRVDIINSEIKKYEHNNTADVELYRYLAVLNILKDLLQQGWSIERQNGYALLQLQMDKMSDKDRIRYRLQPERNAQFNASTTKEFIKKLERQKNFDGSSISIKNLIGDAGALKSKIENQQADCKILEPYIQLVTQVADEHTGYKLNDIWKYFRYTWSIPYKTMPGRNLFYLVRDGSQLFHPVIGIFALGNTVLNLTVRDNVIGWTVTAIKAQMQRATKTDVYKQMLSETNGASIGTKNTVYVETQEEYEKRIVEYSSRVLEALNANLQAAIRDIYVKDLPYYKQTKNPKRETVQELRRISDDLRDKLLDNKKTTGVVDWVEEAETNLFRKKRAQELANLLNAKIVIGEAMSTSPVEWLNTLLKNDAGRTAIHTALIANRKNKIGSNMMEIIVCGAVPPYNELLGGKLVSILACSPRVIADYTKKYNNQVSEIASRMKGSKVVRDSRLVYLGTTSLYSVGSSQYNRIKVPGRDEAGMKLEYCNLGITEGYGTVYFSKETTNYISKLLELIDGGKKINHVFGEGTSPRFRMISRGLSTLGISADVFLRHHSPRIVYSIELARNTREFLLNYTDDVQYGFDLNDETSIEKETKALIDYWYERWLCKRITTVDICSRLEAFDADSILLSNTR